MATLLAVGNFLNQGQARAFHFEYLSKVPEVKDTVHKHSLLHHVCSMIIDKFQDSTDLYSEIGCLTRCAKVSVIAEGGGSGVLIAFVAVVLALPCCFCLLSFVVVFC